MQQRRVISGRETLYAKVVHTQTALVIYCKRSAVFHELHCFKLFSTVSAEALSRSGTFLFMYVVRLDPDLVENGHWKIISNVVRFRVSFSTRNISTSGSILVTDVDILFEWPESPFALTGHSSLAPCMCWEQERGYHARPKVCTDGFLRLQVCIGLFPVDTTNTLRTESF